MSTQSAAARTFEPLPEFAGILRPDRVRRACEADPEHSAEADRAACAVRQPQAHAAEQRSPAGETERSPVSAAAVAAADLAMGLPTGPLSETTLSASPAPAGFSERVNRWFSRVLVQSGLPIGASAMSLACLVAAAACGSGVFMVTENLLATAAATATGTLVPVCCVLWLRRQRKRQILRAIPDAALQFGRIGRTAASRREWEQGFQQVCRNISGPLGDELESCAMTVRAGQSHAAAMGELPQRTGVTALAALAAAAAAIELAVDTRTGSTDADL